MIVAGIGCRKGTSADDIGAVIGAALACAGFAAKALDRIAAPELKRGEQGIAAAAAASATLAGGGLSARLILPRIAVGSATCALAVSVERS